MYYNDIFHQPYRTKIMVMLINAEKVEFKEIKERLELTSGNMTRHMGVLVDHGFVEVEKIFVGKKPKTLYLITETGREAFRGYLKILRDIIEEC